jgi:hypothetical protein
VKTWFQNLLCKSVILYRYAAADKAAGRACKPVKEVVAQYRG